MRDIVSPLDGIRSPFGQRRTFSPSSLFANGEQGLYWDISDFSTMYQDSAGTTPVTALEQPVGLILDKSKGLALGSELVTNGTFDSATTSWSAVNSTLAVSSGTLQITADGAGQARASQNISTVTGRWYEARATVWRGTGAVNVDLLVTGIASSTSVTTTTPTEVVVRFAATGTTTTIRVGTSGAAVAGTTYFADNISVKEIAGNHASQSTSASRPALSARVNLLTYSEQFDNAAWTKSSSSISQNAVAAPDGQTTADKIIEAAATAGHYVSQQVAVVSGVSYVASVSVKAAERGFALIEVGNSLGSSYFWVNLSNGAVGTLVGSGVPAVTASGNGWYRCTFTKSATSTGNGTLAVWSATADNVTSYAGDGTSGIYIWGADLRVTNDGVGLPPYQRVGAATSGSSTAAGNADYDTTGFPVYLRADGVDDRFATGSIDFSGTDKMSVFAGVRKLSSVTGLIAEISANAESTNGAFRIATDAAGYEYLAGSRGTTFQQVLADSASYASPVTNVISMLTSISGPSITFRANGTVVGTETASQGTGNFGNYPLYIGSRGGSSLPFNGRIYGLIVRGAASSAAEISATEAWMATKTGVTL